jgi:hypothetical protein
MLDEEFCFFRVTNALAYYGKVYIIATKIALFYTENILWSSYDDRHEWSIYYKYYLGLWLTTLESSVSDATIWSASEGPQWKRISCKHKARWQHLSWLKASAFFSLQIFLLGNKWSNLYLGLVTPSSGWSSPIMLLESLMRLCHPSGGSTSPKYKLLCFKPP